MKLASFSYQGQARFGRVEGDRIRDLSAAKPAITDLRSFLAAPFDIDPLAGNLPCYPLTDVSWLPVIPNPEKIICIGLNYESHRQELGLEKPAYPMLFARFASSQIGQGDDIVKPRVSEKLDFEGELAVIIGKAGRHITPETAYQYVAGYSCYNDVSVRDWQMHTQQYTAGKNFDQTGAFGPWLVTRDALPDLASRQITTRLNGQQVQQARLDDFIFDIPALIAYISTLCTLVPGDVIVTGTPAGVGVARKPRLYMQPGDQIEVEIGGIGVLSNLVVAEQTVD